MAYLDTIISTMRKLYLIVFLLLLSNLVFADFYLCQSTQISGFVFQSSSGKWIGDGNAADNIYRVSKTADKAGINIGTVWTVHESTKDFGMACNEDFDEQGFLFCSGLGGNFKMNNKTLRFRHLIDIGYVVERYTNSQPEGKYSPQMRIGECKKMKDF